MADYTTTVGHTADPLIATLYRGSEAIPLDAAIDSITLELTDVYDATSQHEVDVTGSVSDAAGGEITHTWTDDFPPAGLYHAQFRINYTNGQRRYVPNAAPLYRFDFLAPIDSDDP